MEYLFIYLLQMFSNIEGISFLMFIICTISSFVLIPLYLHKNDDFYKSKALDDAFDFCKKIAINSFIICLILTFIPTKQTLLLMGGVYLGKKAVNTVITDKKIEKVNTIIELELDKRIKELKGEN